MHPILFRLGPLEIRTYGLMLSAAFLIGVWLAGRRASARGVAPAHVYDISIAIILAAVVGARAYYVILHWRDFSLDPLSALYVWEGGLAMYGGLILSLVTAGLFCRARGVPFQKMADIVAPSLAIGVSVTRVGCFFNGCCFGRPTTSMLGVKFPPASEAGSIFFGKAIHPTQLYSSLYGLIIFLVLLAMDRRPRRDGFLIGLFLTLYSASRFAVDFLRYYDPETTFQLSHVTFNYNQVISLFLFLFGVILILLPGSASWKESRERGGE
jgi:phosphatidylglycerol:prolipoprotein diacylglycerol transferase